MYAPVMCKCKTCNKFIEPILITERKVIKLTIYNISDIIEYDHTTCECPYCLEEVYSPRIRRENLSRRSEAIAKVRDREIEVRIIGETPYTD